MKDKHGKKIKIGDAVRCDNDTDYEYSFNPAEGIIISKRYVKLYKCSNEINDKWNRKGGWPYYFDKEVEKISKNNSWWHKHLLDKLKE